MEAGGGNSFAGEARRDYEAAESPGNGISPWPGLFFSYHAHNVARRV
jgi:hypothetical protein